MSTVKVNTVDKRTGGTLTLGGCGTTVTLGAGATQSGFGRTGTVDWCTTAKTAPFTGVSGNGYFVNTTSGAVTVTLPATPSAGDIISIADYASTFQTNNLTLCNNSSKINGVCSTALLSTQGQSITLVYVDATRGWKNTMDSTSNVTGAPNYIVATGGTITCCGDYKIHTFTSDGCFSVTNAGTPAGSTTVDYLVVAGGGGGGTGSGGGAAGAGGFRESKNPAAPWTASPLVSATSLPVTNTAYPITVGGGGAAAPSTSTPSATGTGSNSVFSTITSAGGGGGGSESASSPIKDGASGGSGGGGNYNGGNVGGTGNTPPTSPAQGNNGGAGGGSYAGGGGGGATGTGSNYSGPGNGGNGGAGATTSISGSPTAYAGGGGGGSEPPGSTAGTGGTGGGGTGGFSPSTPGTPGTVNTGGGGGGGKSPTGANGGTGGSGIVIIRYKYQ
jgi:hypothetical protein